MNIKFSTIGLGACGNNVAEALGELKIPYFLINSTKDDLPNTDNPLCDGWLVFNQLDGTAKNRTKVQEKIKEQYQELIEEIEKNSTEILKADIIFVPTSTNGGTGSGSTTILTDILSSLYPNKIFIVIGVTPSHTEDVMSFKNSVDFGKELADLNVPYMLFDNDKADGSRYRVHNTINDYIKGRVEILTGSFVEPGHIQNVDKSEWLETLAIPGLMSVFSVEDFNRKEFEKQGFDGLFSTTYLNDLQVDRQRDNYIKRSIIVQSLTEDVMNNCDINVSQIQDEIGLSLKTFNHIQKDKENNVDVILSGQSFPDNVFEKLAQMVLDHKDRLGMKNTSKIKDISDRIGDIDDGTGRRVKKNMDNILNRY